MPHTLQVVVDQTLSGEPHISVPLDDMWNLVEYLSWQRVLAHYDYAQTHFTVSFPHLDAAAAQRLIDEWNSGAHRPARIDILPLPPHAAALTRN